MLRGAGYLGLGGAWYLGLGGAGVPIGLGGAGVPIGLGGAGVHIGLGTPGTYMLRYTRLIALTTRGNHAFIKHSNFKHLICFHLMYSLPLLL